MRRRQFYDPEIQTAPPAPDPIEVRGVVIEKPGAYVHISDVAAVLMRLAEQTHDAGREALVMAAGCFVESEPVEEEVMPVQPSDTAKPGFVRDAAEPTVTPGVLRSDAEPGAASYVPLAPVIEEGMRAMGMDAPSDSLIARVEVYPNEDASYWYARAVTATGEIIPTEAASGISRDQLERDIARRWPGVHVYEIPDAMGDSIWDEQSHVFGFNGRRRPSPRRIWQQ